MFSNVAVVAIYVLRLIWPSAAYSWQLNAAPTQCADISITVTGSDGQPPYNVLVVPYGPPPFENKIDVRGVILKNFDGNSNSVNVPIKYPANTQFVAVVSDTAGFGTGGTSAPTLVGESGDNSCFNASQPWSAHFWFYIGPITQPAAEVVQCNTTRIWWNSTADVEGPPSFVGIIPAGISFSIPETGTTNTSDEGTGFFWLPRIREGTQLVMVGGDNRGLGAGGSAQFTVAHSDESSCVTAANPSTVPGTIAGAIVTQPNMAPIIGGAVGGSLGFVALGAIVAYLFIRHRRKYRNRSAVYPLQDTIAKPSDFLLQYDIEPFADQELPVNRFGYESAAQAKQDGMANTTGRHISPRPSATGLVPGLMAGQSSHPPSSPSMTVIQSVDGGPYETAAQNMPMTRTVNLPPTYDSLTNAQPNSTH